MILYSYNKRLERSVYMDKTTVSNEFVDKFKQLNMENQRYIIAIQQALIFAQSSEERNAKQKI